MSFEGGRSPSRSPADETGALGRQKSALERMGRNKRVVSSTESTDNLNLKHSGKFHKRSAAAPSDWSTSLWCAVYALLLAIAADHATEWTEHPTRYFHFGARSVWAALNSMEFFGRTIEHWLTSLFTSASTYAVAALTAMLRFFGPRMLKAVLHEKTQEALNFELHYEAAETSAMAEGVGVRSPGNDGILGTKSDKILTKRPIFSESLDNLLSKLFVAPNGSDRSEKLKRVLDRECRINRKASWLSGADSLMQTDIIDPNLSTNKCKDKDYVHSTSDGYYNSPSLAKYGAVEKDKGHMTNCTCCQPGAKLVADTEFMHCEHYVKGLDDQSIFSYAGLRHKWRGIYNEYWHRLFYGSKKEPEHLMLDLLAAAQLAMNQQFSAAHMLNSAVTGTDTVAKEFVLCLASENATNAEEEGIENPSAIVVMIAKDVIMLHGQQLVREVQAAQMHEKTEDGFGRTDSGTHMKQKRSANDLQSAAQILKYVLAPHCCHRLLSKICFLVLTRLFTVG